MFWQKLSAVNQITPINLDAKSCVRLPMLTLVAIPVTVLREPQYAIEIIFPLPSLEQVFGLEPIEVGQVA